MPLRGNKFKWTISPRGKAVARCLWLVARKNLLLYSNGLWSNLATGRLTQAAPTKALTGYFFCKQSPLTSIAYMRFCRGRPELSDPSSVKDSCPDGWQRRAARYALRASRSVVVSLSLSRRNAASESEEKRKSHDSWFVVRGS
jgi:hypothetical protein